MKRTVVILVLLALAGFAVSAAAEGAGPAYGFKFSGYFKTDFVYDQTRVNSGNYALYVIGAQPRHRARQRPDEHHGAREPFRARFLVGRERHPDRRPARVRFLWARRFAGEPQLDGEQGRAHAPPRIYQAHEGELVAARRADERHHLAARAEDGQLHRSLGSGQHRLPQAAAPRLDVGESVGQRQGHVDGRPLPHARRRHRRRQGRRRR